jgi:hypothetical protein
MTQFSSVRKDLSGRPAAGPKFLRSLCNEFHRVQILTMMTFRLLSKEPATLPVQTSWHLADLAEARGKQVLFTRQSPQKLKALRERADPAGLFNRIEGVG